jgi:2',3'-cyclic-nucleotide 2'-phosphodiesterase/3'-nucleotidase
MDFVLEVERKATGAQLSSAAAFSLDAKLPQGIITKADVARLYPYENTLTVVKITGVQLANYLEWSARYFGQAGSTEHPINPSVPAFNYDILAGADYTLDLSRPAGSRVTRLQVDGRDVAPSDTFTLAVSDFRQSGGGGYAMLRDAPVVSRGQLQIRDLLLDEIRHAGTLRQEAYFKPNWQITPPPSIGPAYAAMHRARRSSVNSHPIQDY